MRLRCAMARVRVNCKQCENFPRVVCLVTGGVACLCMFAESKSMWNYVCVNRGLVATVYCRGNKFAQWHLADRTGTNAH